MGTDQQQLEKIALVRLLRLDAKLQGIVTGIVLGLGLFVATNWLILKGGEVVGPHLALLNQFFIGYEVSFVGSLIGLGYGFVTGFVVGYGTTAMYNQLVVLKDRRQS
jgi:hypothetical protein